MATPKPVLFFDFTDPGSYLASHLLDRAGADDRCVWHGLELRPPPRALVDTCDRDWQSYHALAADSAGKRGIPMNTPTFVPWTRKAHELAEFAREEDCYHAVRRALFEAHFVDRRDIGRIDLLVEVAAAAGLDSSGAKAALDVDRFAATVQGRRELAKNWNVAEVPAVVHGTRRIEGMKSPARVSEWTRWVGVELFADKEE
ncbi:MAG: DsbA family protein [Gemmatimonadota bacterium]|nr:DsbA family protein [Gemmatimonadota bacterium]